MKQAPLQSTQEGLCDSGIAQPKPISPYHSYADIECDN
jgi:hypothetical protein